MDPRGRRKVVVAVTGAAAAAVLLLMVVFWEELGARFGFHWPCKGTSQIDPPIVGIVQVVRPQEKLVVLSVGNEQGVEEGLEFAVSRGGRLVGTLVVIRVYPDLCGARIRASGQDEAIQIGDKAEATLNYLCPLSRCRERFQQAAAVTRNR